MDDDESSISSKSDCVKALGSLELRNWLSHHNKNISKRYEQHESSEKRRKQLLHSLGSDADPEKSLGSIMELAFPRIIKKNGKVANMALSSTACNQAVEKMLRDPSLHERHNAGMNAATLLAEQRRKIVMNALTDSGYEKEDRVVSQKKVNELIEGRVAQSTGMLIVDDGKGYSAKFSHLSTPATTSHSHTRHNEPHGRAPVSHQPSIEPRRFNPKWDHYDTMRARWGYIQPQVKKLLQDDQLIAPRSYQKQIKVNKETLIHGNLNDIYHFEAQRDKKTAKEISTMSKTQQMEADRIAKANIHYIPCPSVRY